MTASIIDGREVAKKTNTLTQQRVTELKQQGINPGLAVILVGDNQASARYVRNKHRKAQQLGINSIVKKMPSSTTQQELIDVINQYNQDPTINGILVQSPLPPQINEKLVDNQIIPSKDVDGFHPLNVGKLYLNDQDHYPVACTPRGVMTMFESYHIDLVGKKVVVIGRSSIVGRPMAALLINASATVTVLNSHTPSIAEYTKDADIVISAVGKLNVITKQDIKPGAILIDVGQNLDENGKLVGDINPDAFEIAGAYTPVPGGVGPMTIATLMQQTVNLAEWSAKDAK